MILFINVFKNCELFLEVNILGLRDFALFEKYLLRTSDIIFQFLLFFLFYVDLLPL